MTHRLAPLLAPASIAFVGASAKPNSPGNDMLRMIRRGGFQGAVHAVNPNYSEVEGFSCLPSLSAIATPVDLAVLSVANHRLEAALEEAIAIKARAAVIFASGHVAGDPDLPARLAAKAKAAGMQICGGNCMGYYNDSAQTWAVGFPSPREPGHGSITYLAQSGSAFGVLAHNDPRFAFNLVVSSGQELTTTVADYMDYALDLPSTKVIGLFLETVRDPQGFVRALARAATQGIPVVALKVGRTEAAAAMALSHTGAISGSDAAHDALFDRFGVIRVSTMDELGATLMAFAPGRKAPKGAAVAIGDSGGEREMLVDLAEREGVPWAELAPETVEKIEGLLDAGLEPGNPLDAWGTGENFSQNFADCLSVLLADPNAALGLFAVDMRDGSYIYEGFAETALTVAAATDKPLMVVPSYSQVRHATVSLRLARAGVPVLDGTHHALVAARAMLSHRDFMGRADDPAPEGPSEAILRRWVARFQTGAPLAEAEGLALLRDWRIPVVESRSIETVEQARAAGAALGYPVALKTAAPGILHKSDVGGVVLNLRNEAELTAAYEAMAKRLGPQALVAVMGPGGAELALGMVRDPQFGPVVMVAAGGVLVELLDDAVHALAPFGPIEAERLLNRLRLRRQLDGARGRPAADMPALIDALVRFSVLCADVAPWIGAIDVNPLMAGVRVLALDALLIPSETR